ncbi:uncharacterized protein LOC116175515 [Photinus pyralis]|uniref:uncharacterized protein LOC116175515 n=1 Tax=Photinus pyralis TaxID=7054 RepID=UPI0012678160|nr:uncharacterized protein LOC116175515 [Photinus pyralis]
MDKGETPTFVTSRRQEVIDLTLGSFSIAHMISNWRVSDEPSLSDHRHILFQLNLSFNGGPCKFRNPRTTNWDCYVEKLTERLDKPPLLCRKAGQVEEAAAMISDAITASFEDSCKLRTVRGMKRTPWWNSDLEKVRKEVRRLFNRAMRTKLPADWEDHKLAQRRYKDHIRRSKRGSWRTFCGNMEGLPEVQKLRSGDYVTSEPPEGATRVGARPIDWRVAAGVVTKGSLRWAINTFSPFKSAGPDGIFPALLQKGLEPLLLHLLHLFRASVALGYIP